MITPGQVKQAILNWSGGKTDVPALEAASDLADAANAMPDKVDPWLPVVMALRETGGGRSMGRVQGANNWYNMAFDSDNKKYMDYSSPSVAIKGGSDPSGVHAGFAGLINHTIPTQSDIYADYRNSGDLADLFKHYSPYKNNDGSLTGNGTLGQQIDNYNFIRNQAMKADTIAPTETPTPSPTPTPPVSSFINSTKAVPTDNPLQSFLNSLGGIGKSLNQILPHAPTPTPTPDPMDQLKFTDYGVTPQTKIEQSQ